MPVAQTIPVNVNYSNGTFSYSPDAAPNVAVLQNNSGNSNYAIVFTLTGATWDDSWITWGPGNGQPPDVQSGYTLPLANGNNQKVVGVHNNNSGTSQQIYNFVLNVVANGEKKHSPDPDIVLDPP